MMLLNQFVGLIVPQRPDSFLVPMNSAERSGILAAVVGGIVVTIGSALVTYSLTKSSAHREIERLSDHLRTLRGELAGKQSEYDRLTDENAILKPQADKYESVRIALQNSSVTKNYHQPVLLLGPRFVGKSSLLMQWHAPWNHNRLAPNRQAICSEVPIHDFVESNAEPHFADPTIKTKVNAHLHLRVHDFPGEVSFQKQVRETAVAETSRLNDSNDKDLGIVLICMFEAPQLASGINEECHKYYNAELFRELFTLVVQGRIAIERVILVFNKYDELRTNVGWSDSDDILLQQCLHKTESLYSPLFNICNRERFCAVFTVLSREDMHEKNRGAPIVLGEAARNFVRAFAGAETEQRLIEGRATSIASSGTPPPIY